MIQAHVAELMGLGQIRQRECLEAFQLAVQRMPEITHPGIGHQRLLAAGQKLVKQRQVFAVLQHISHQDQIETVRLAKEIAGIAQLHLIERRIGLAGCQRQRVEIARQHFQCACFGCSNRGYA